MSLQAKDDTARLLFFEVSSKLTYRHTMITTSIGGNATVVGCLALQQPEFTYSDSAFGNFLSNPSSELEIDLSKATLIEVIQQHSRFKRRTSSNYSDSSLIFNIQRLEDMFRCTIMPKQINDIFYSYFVQFLSNKGLVYSTIETYCTQIRSSLKWGLRHNCPVSSTYDLFDIPKYSKTKVALTPDQISHIYHYDLKKIPWQDLQKHRYSYVYLERVKDMLVLSCSLGQRFSDMVRICPDHFDDTLQTFSIVQQKTANKATININEWSIDRRVVRAILTKYGYFAPKVSTIGNYNYAIKFILEHIGEEFLQPISTENKIGGKIVKATTPLFKMVSSHTGRRTFDCYHLLQGRREIDIRKCTGHSDARSFSAYDVRETVM